MEQIEIPRDQTNQNSACFEGFHLNLLSSLREFLSSYNLTVIDNPEAGQACLYHIVCGNEEQLKLITELSLVKSKKQILVCINGNRDEMQAISQKFNAVVARITHKQITSAESRVIFGSLFNDHPEVLVIHEETINDPSNSSFKTPVSDQETFPINNTDTINKLERDTEKLVPLTSPSSTTTTSNSGWDQHQKVIDGLLQQIYPPKKTGQKKITRLFLLFRYASSILLLFSIIHVFLLVVSIFSLSRLQPDTSLAMLKATGWALKATTVSGSVLTMPLHVFIKQTTYDPVLILFDRIATIIDKGVVVKNNLSFDAIIQPSSEASSVIKFQQLIQQWRLLSPDVLLLIGDLKKIQQTEAFPWNLKITKDFLIPKIEKVVEYKNTADTLVSLGALFEQLFSNTKTASVLLLLQNNRELRPTGGFIGSVGFATLINGVIDSFTINDVYDIDGQLKGHVAPPAPISTIIGQEHWYLRDSNWSPDFFTSATQAQRFLEASVDKKADMVVGITLPVLEDILKITGPLTLIGTDVIVSADTVFQHIYNQTRNDFFPGSSAKKDALSAIASSIQTALTSLNAQQQFRLASVIAERFSSRDIQLMSGNTRDQEELINRGFAGVFPQVAPCANSTESCFQDVFALVEANLGVNKTNNLIDRSVEREVVFEKEEVLRADSINFTSNVTTESLGGGHYTSYHRLYYPVGTTISSVSLNDIPVEISTATTSGLLLPYAEILNEFPRVITLGVAIDLPPGERATLLIRSRQSTITPPQNYSLWIFKQAGVNSLPFQLGLTPPIGKRAVSKNFEPLLLANGSKISYNSMLQRDKNLLLSLQPED